MSATLIKTLHRAGLGSLTGIAFYLFMAVTAVALTGIYTSLFTLSTEDWAWFTIGNSPSWFVLGYPENWKAIAPTYTVARIVLSVAIGLIIAAWEVVYILGSEEVNWGLVFGVAILGVLVIILSQVIWTVL